MTKLIDSSTIYNTTSIANTSVADSTKSLLQPIDNTVASNTLFTPVISKENDPSNSITIEGNVVEPTNDSPKIVDALVSDAITMVKVFSENNVPVEEAKEQIVDYLKQEIAQDIAQDGTLIDATIEKTAVDAIKDVTYLAELEAARAKADLLAQIEAEKITKENIGAPAEQAEAEKAEAVQDANVAVEEKKVEVQQEAINTIVYQKEQVVDQAHNALAQEQANLNNFAERVVDTLVGGGVMPEPPVSVVEPIAKSVGARRFSLPWWVWLLAAAGGGYLLTRK